MLHSIGDTTALPIGVWANVRHVSANSGVASTHLSALCSPFDEELQSSSELNQANLFDAVQKLAAASCLLHN